jgi:uncharacterized protein with HEPN domain
MYFEPRDFLRHIFAETEFLLRQRSGLELDSFLEDETLRRAFVRSLEIIGEAAKKIPEDFRLAHSEIEWRSMAGMRDRLIHGYFGIDYDLVWEVVDVHIPVLHKQIAEILEG